MVGSFENLPVTPFLVSLSSHVWRRKHTLQLFRGVRRSSYAGTRVDVHGPLNGRLLVCRRRKLLTPGEGPALAM